jgi:predicted alpha/beta superfamily hydrolase
MRFLRINLFILLFAQIMFSQQESRVELRSFYSHSLGITKSFNIYLPPGYDSTSDHFPVVYFLRGHEREWFNPAEDGSRNGNTLQKIADTLLSKGRIGKMILVGPSTASADNSVPAPGVNMLAPGSDAGIGSGKFENYFTVDLIHYVDSAYRTIPDREHRGIDGFSLGGYTSVMLGLKHPELFSSVGCYDGTHMWYNLNDTRISGTPPDDGTWLSGNTFDQAFGSPRNVDYMLQYNSVNILLAADTAQLRNIWSIRFWIHSAAYDGMQGNIDRGMHVVNNMLGKGIVNGFADIRVDTNAVHNWHYADLHASQSLVKHWQSFTVTGVKSKGLNVMPKNFKLYQNYPNPFNPQTTIHYDLAEKNAVRLDVYDVLGRVVSILTNELQPAGEYTAMFDGDTLPTGVYFYRLQAGNYSDCKKLVLTK